MNLGAEKLSRRQGDKTQAELAVEIGIDQGYLCRLLSGQRVPGLKLRRRLHDAFKIPILDWDEPARGAA